MHEVVWKHDRERLVAHERARREHRMPEAERFLLTDVGNGREIRNPARLPYEVVLSALPQRGLEFIRDVEVILHGRLRATRDDDDVLDAGCDCFLDRVLNDRFVDHAEHFLRHRFRSRKKPCAEPGGGNDDFSDLLGHPGRK